MPAVQTFTRYTRVTIAGDVVKIVDGSVQINESVEQLCSVASFSLNARPSSTPANGDSVLIEQIDMDAHVAYALFGGTINIVEVDSAPWTFRITACDQLEKLRRVKQTGDLDLTGMTEGEAWKAIADACDLDYDDDDICDSGYHLGGYVDVKWHDDQSTSGGAMIAELDRVFGHATMTIGDNRVIRIHLDEAPDDGTGLYRSYTKDVNVTFLTNRRSLGDRDQLQNVWTVTGVTDEISKSCTAQSWAKSVSGSGYLSSRRVRVAEQTFSSDFIQDESLAVEIVKRLMRKTNRLPDTASIAIANDPQIHPGKKVRIIDHSYGNATGAGRYGMIRSLVRSGNTMACEITSGPGGDTGTITHGTEKVCNDTQSSGSRDDGFVDPGFDYPPDFPGTDDEFTFPGGTDDADPDGDGIPNPIIGCTTDATFTDCTADDSDTCIDGSLDQGTITGSPPAFFCTTYFGSNSLTAKAFTAGGGAPGSEYSASCRVNVPWREVGTSGTAYYHVTDAGAVDWVQTIDISPVYLYASDETDPALQDDTTDTQFGVPVIQSVWGVVLFNEPGAVLVVNMPPTYGGVEHVGGPSMIIYADPGSSFTPADSTTEYTIGVQLTTDFQGPIKIGDVSPHESLGATKKDNGGYVISSPAALGVPVAFSVFFDETRKDGWGMTTAATDLGSGYIDHLDYISSGSPLPGEPADPTNTCAGDHDSHRLRVALIPGATGGTQEAPAVRLYGLVVGHSTCEVNIDYTPG